MSVTRWCGPDGNVTVLASDYDALRREALAVANAIHAGTAMMIRGTMMEDDLRKALGLKPGELWNFTTGKAEPSKFLRRAPADGEKHGR